MPSHLKEWDELPTGVSEKDRLGDAEADKLAGRAAELAAVSMDVASPVTQKYALVKKIQNLIGRSILNIRQ